MPLPLLASNSSPGKRDCFAKVLQLCMALVQDVVVIVSGEGELLTILWSKVEGSHVA